MHVMLYALGGCLISLGFKGPFPLPHEATGDAYDRAVPS